MRKLRSDAVRSRTALLDAAICVLADDPEADLARVANSARLSRQTLYAHFGSRAGLLDAVVEHITAEVRQLLDDARLDEGTASEALSRYLDLFDRLPPEWLRVASTASEDHDRAKSSQLHSPVLEPLAAVVRRGQADGEFTADLPTDWLVETTVALGHTAYGMESRGALTRPQARAALRATLMRSYAAD